MQAVIARYTGVLAAADVPTFTTSTSTSIAQSVRLDLGTGSQVTRDGNEMAPDSSGRVAIVVRAGGELGRATAQELAAAGFTVIGVDRNEDGPKELPDGIRYEGGDATTRPWPRSVVDRIAVEVGPPGVLVNTRGTYHTWAGREHGPAGLGAGGPDPGAVSLSSWRGTTWRRRLSSAEATRERVRTARAPYALVNRGFAVRLDAIEVEIMCLPQ